MLRTLFSATLLVGALTGGALAQTPAGGCELPAEPEGIPAALDAAITGPADKDRHCMQVLFVPEAQLTFVSVGSDGVPGSRIETGVEWIARVKARGHSLLTEKQLKYRVERYGNIAHLWSSYALQSDGKEVARGVNSIQAVRTSNGWHVAGILVQAESAAVPLPRDMLP